MLNSTQIVDIDARVKVHSLSHDPLWQVRHNVDMATSPNHLRAWRKHKKLTQQELAERIDPPTTKQVIAAIETGARGLSDKWLRRLAPVLGTTPGILLDYHPEQLPPEWIELFGDIPNEQRDQALAVLRTFKRTGTEG